MNVRRFTKFAFVLAIVALIAGLSACDQIGQLLVPAPPEMERYECRDSHRRRRCADWAIRRRNWYTDAKWL